jgi:hypothetical protein
MILNDHEAHLESFQKVSFHPNNNLGPPLGRPHSAKVGG